MPLPTRLDRATLRLITVKRSITGTLSLGCGVALASYGYMHVAQFDGKTRYYWMAAVVVFLFGGSWSLRDAVRGWKLLRG